VVTSDTTITAPGRPRDVTTPTSTIDERVFVARLTQASEQTGIAFVSVLLALILIGFLIQDIVDQLLLLCAFFIISVYSIRFWLALIYLKLSPPDNSQQKWLYLHIFLATLSGICWGGIIAILIVRNIPDSGFILGFMIFSLTAGGLTSLGIIAWAYSGYLMGLLLPVSIAFIWTDTRLNITLGIMTIIYGIFLAVAVSSFRKMINVWLEQSIENDRFTSDLIDQKRRSDQTVLNLESTIERRKKRNPNVEHNRVTLSSLRGQLPGMTYRAKNDGHWSLEFVSEGCKELLGITYAEFLNQGKSSLSDLLVRSDRSSRGLEFTSDDGESFHYEYTLLTPSGDERLVVERGLRVFDELGLLKAIEGFVTDASANHRILSDIRKLPNCDYLTDLPNRYQFQAIVDDLLATTNPDNTYNSLLYIDIDQFNMINNTSDYATGDKIIRQISSLLQKLFNDQKAFVSRLCGDEFGVLLENCNSDNATLVASELCRAIQHYDFNANDRQFDLTASIGVATSGKGIASLQDLLRAAHSVMFVAKEKGGNRVQNYQPQDKSLVRYNQEMKWVVEVPKAIAEERLVLEQQQIIPFNKDSFPESWYEILLRIEDWEGHLITAAEFMPTVERYNLSTDIDTWVVQTVITHLSQNSSTDAKSNLYFINLSRNSLRDNDFLERITGLLTKYPTIAGMLCFEITETGPSINVEQILDAMRNLKRLGCRFALDDFGTGLSSFGHLRDLPVDFLKIDGSLTSDIAQNSLSRSIATSITELGHACNKSIIAECVETDAVLESLREIGIDFAQGDWLAKPSPFLDVS